jgi:S1-C subfamily serine protease
VTTRSRATPRRITPASALPPRRALTVTAALLLAGAVALVLSPFRGGEAAPPRLLRVTSGSEIATGFAAGGNRIVTVAHVIDGGRVAVSGHRARVLRVDRRRDLALLSVQGLVARDLDTQAAGSGASVRVIRLRNGRPSSLSVHVRRAIVAHVRVPGTARAVGRPALELAARVAPGDSGAPVVSNSGALAGVVFAASSARVETAYAVDASAVKRLLAGH